MSMTANASECNLNAENGEAYLTPKFEDETESSYRTGSPTDDSQLGDIGAMAIQQLAAASQATGPVSEEIQREMEALERDIKRQKESSVNAKTAITFEQLKRIHLIGKMLGPGKEVFFDKICRAADIQRASLKNRLKQNKEKFEPSLKHPLGAPRPTHSPSFGHRNGAVAAAAPMSVDSPVPVPQDFQQMFNNGALSFLCTNPEMMMNLDFKPQQFNLRAPPAADVRSITPVSAAEEDTVRIPVERVNELFQLGFTYEEVREFTGLFEQFKSLSRDICMPAQLLTAFSNFISQSVPEPLKLICTTFNLLEMGYTRREMLKIVNKERRHREEEDQDSDCKPPSAKKMCSDNGECSD